MIQREAKKMKMNEKTTSIWDTKRDGKVYSEIIPNCTAKTLETIILAKVDTDYVILSDGRK